MDNDCTQSQEIKITGTALDGKMTKSNLPTVTEATIAEIGNEILTNNEAAFMQMAVSQPDLCRFIYGIHQLPDTNKTTMLGVAVAMYHILDRQIKKGKQDKRRLRHDGN